MAAGRRRPRLAERRAQLGLSQEDAAQRAGVDRSTYARWERGETQPQPWKRAGLEKALRVTPTGLSTLLSGEHSGSSTTNAPASGVPLSHVEGEEVVEVIFKAAQDFQITDRRLGGGALFPSVSEYLTSEIGPQLVSPTRGVPVPRLFAAAASVTEIAGWMAHDSGDDSAARDYFDRAFRLALAGHDRALAANACASMAHLAIELRQAEDALRIAGEGLEQATTADGTTRLVARLHAMRARGLALAGDHAACSSALDEAQQALSNARDEEPAQWIAAFDEASLASEAALCFLQLAELREAERCAREVIRLRQGDRIRSRAFGKLTLANVLVRAGRPDEAAALGNEVCATTSSLTSARVVRQLHALGGVLTLAPASSQVSSFREALAGLAAVPGADTSWPV